MDVKEEAYNFLNNWTYKIGVYQNPSYNVVQFLKRFRPKNKVTLYRAERYGFDINRATNKDFTSFTYSRDFVQNIVEYDREIGIKSWVKKRTIEPR